MFQKKYLLHTMFVESKRRNPGSPLWVGSWALYGRNASQCARCKPQYPLCGVFNKNLLEHFKTQMAKHVRLQNTEKHYWLGKGFRSNYWVDGRPISVLCWPSSVVLVEAVEESMPKLPGDKFVLILDLHARSLASRQWVKYMQFFGHHFSH